MKHAVTLVVIFALLLCVGGCTEIAPIQTSDPVEESMTAVTAESTLPPETEQPQETTIPTTDPTVVTTGPLWVEPEEDDFVRVLDYIPSARQALAYATTDNFTGQVIYEFTDVYLRYGTVKKLAAVAAELEEQGLGLLIWDGYRPVYAQAKLYDVCPNPTYVSPPGVGNQNHCRGRAVDITLVELETGEELEMPTGFDDFSDYADRDYSDVSPTAAANARLLEEVMTEQGFRGYSAEWWHYNDTDTYPIEETFDPAEIS